MNARQRRLIRVLGLATFFEGYGRSLIVNTLPYVGNDLGATPAELSRALALISIGSFSVLILGPLADRFGRRRLLLVSVLLLSVLGAAGASATTLSALVLWQAGARMFQEGALFAAGVILAEEMPAERRAEAQGLLGTVNSVGSGFGALLLATIESWPGSWRGLLLVSLVPLALLPILRRVIPESHRWLARRERALHLPPPTYRARMAAAAVVIFLGMSYDVAGFSFVTYWPRMNYGWSPQAISAMVVFAGAVGLPGWWLGGQLADRFGRRRMAVLFFVGLAGADVAFYLGGSAALWPAFAAMVFCQGGKITVLRSWATELFPTSFRGAAAGWLAASGMLGGVVALWLAGELAPAVGGLGRALALMASAGLLGAIAAHAWLPETRGLELETIAPEVA